MEKFIHIIRPEPKAGTHFSNWKVMIKPSYLRFKKTFPILSTSSRLIIGEYIKS